MTSAPAVPHVPHHQALELISARALASGDVVSAFAFADRRCRIPPLAEPHCFVLRADALYRMGEKELALLDVARAIEIAPDEIAPNRRLLAWAEGDKRRDAALRLIARDRDSDWLRNAISILREGGRRAFASARIVSGTIRGWGAWPQTGSLEIVVAEGPNSVAYELEEDPMHPLANVVGCAADFVLPLLASDSALLITVSCDDETLVSISYAGDEVGPHQCGPHDRQPSLDSRHMPEATATCTVTVIVPIYADFTATRACVESLLAQRPDLPRSRVMLVNDASPDADIQQYLVSLSNDERVEILINERNLGFVGAVNRALSEVLHGDIVLLNADTIVPPGFVDRLAAAAHSSPQIGTVTPLSNNGEFTSFPVPNTQNPLPSPADIIAIDRVAAKVNAGRIVDIPNGIGFCLFVKRACLDAVGFLSNSYDRGYLEDVDFCLRARERGFRNVCAPSVYVGHTGSRSFGREKRSLVVRNLAVAERRFPTYRSECAAFVTLDPLRIWRQAIERVMPSCDREPLLLVTGEGAVAAAAHARARQIEASGRRALMLTFRRTSRGGVARLADASGAAPQSMVFQLDVADDVAELMAYLRATKPVRTEIADPAAIPRVLLDELMALGLPYDVLIADGGLLGDAGALHRGGRAQQRRSTGADRLFALRELMAGADRLLAPCEHAEAFVARWFPDGAAARVQRIYSHAGTAPEPYLRPSDGSRRRLGIIPIESGLHEQQFIRDLAACLRTTCPHRAMVVTGDTPDSLGLMRIGNTLVTGSIGVGELADACRAHGVGALLPCATRPLFGHPLQSFALSCGLPIAYFDWSGGGHRARHGDLLLDPSAPIGELVAALVAWQGAH